TIVDVRANQAWSETKDGMRIDWDVPIETDDDLVLRADVFRPDGDFRYPVILGATPYGKCCPSRTRSGAVSGKCYARMSLKFCSSGTIRSRALCPGARRRTWHGTLTWIYGPAVGSRDAGSLSMHRMGGAPAVVERSCRAQWSVVSRDESVAGGRGSAPPSLCGMRGGRVLPLFSRGCAARWDFIACLWPLV